MAGLEHWGVGGAVVAVAVPLVRVLVIAKISLWSLKQDAEGQKHALALIRALKWNLPFKRRSR